MSPDYTGLDLVPEEPISEGGAARTSKFQEYISTKMKERANIQKQQRLFRQQRQGVEQVVG